jgi:predicted RNA-binding protein Jag
MTRPGSKPGSIFEGRTLDDAVRKGLEALGLSRAEVMITMLEEGSGGFLGLGARPYKVRIMPRPGGAIPEPADRGERGEGRRRDRGRERGGRDRGEHRGGNGRRSASGRDRDRGRGDRRGGQERSGDRPGRPMERGATMERGGERGPERGVERGGERGGERGVERGGERGGERGAERGGERGAERGAPMPQARGGEGAPEIRGGRDEGDRRRRRGRRGGRGREREGMERMTEAPPAGMDVAAEETREPFAGAEPRAAVEHSGPALAPAELEAEGKRWTLEFFKAMGFEATVSAKGEADRVDVTATVPEHEELLTGRKGEVRQALQHLLNRMINRGEGSRYHLQLEINEFWKRREDELIGLARQLADEAVDSQSEAVTEYLNAQERRVIHVTLRDDSRVKTYALGSGMIKRLAVAPADFAGGSQEEE